MKTLLLLAAAAAATPAPKPFPAPSEIVAAAPKGDWVAIPASDLLVMDLASGKRVVIQLMPPPFSQGWVGNIRKLSAAHWWDGTSINRAQDNYVVQWGDANAEDKAKAKKLPEGLSAVPQSEYTVDAVELMKTAATAAMEAAARNVHSAPNGSTAASKAPHWTATRKTEGGELVVVSRGRSKVPYGNDPYGASAFAFGWPTGISKIGTPKRPQFRYHPIHCYGMVGVGRDMPPSTGTGAELYAVIGHATRHLDRNIALVGRVISGIENLSSLPRGTGALGFYEKPEQRVTITSIRLGTDVKDLPRYQYLSTESESFAKYADARANRRDPFFIVPAGGADICNIPVPVRAVK